MYIYIYFSINKLCKLYKQMQKYVNKMMTLKKENMQYQEFNLLSNKLDSATRFSIKIKLEEYLVYYSKL